MEQQHFIQDLRAKLANNEVEEVLRQLQIWLRNSPALDEVLLQSARHQEILKQIRLGIIEYKEATLTQNQVHWALLAFLRDMEQGFTSATEYDAFLQDVAHYRHNQSSSTSQPLIGKTVEALHKKSLKKLFSQNRTKQYLSFRGIKANADTAYKLRALNLMTNGYVLKGTFLCLAGTEQIRSVSQNAHLSKFFVFEDIRGMRTAVVEFVSGNLIEQFEQMLEHIKKHLYLHRNIDSRTEDFEIPGLVFTELLANAFIHRTYEPDVLTDVKVEIYPDRMEISNPGRFPADIDLEHIEQNNKSFLFNPEIVQMFFLHNFVETAAKGIARSQETLASHHMTPAVFAQKSNYVNVIIYKKNFSQNNPSPPNAQTERLQRLKDEAAWKAAVELDTIAAFETYLYDYGFSLHRDEAEARIVSLQTSELKEKASKKNK